MKQPFQEEECVQGLGWDLRTGKIGVYFWPCHILSVTQFPSPQKSSLQSSSLGSSREASGSSESPAELLKGSISLLNCLFNTLYFRWNEKLNRVSSVQTLEEIRVLKKKLCVFWTDSPFIRLSPSTSSSNPSDKHSVILISASKCLGNKLSQSH